MRVKNRKTDRHPKFRITLLYSERAHGPLSTVCRSVKKPLIWKIAGFLKMATAMWNGQVLAESDSTLMVEGNVYFPEESVKREFLRPSSTTSSCPAKGQARYYTLLVDGQENPDAAWYYPDPRPAARTVKHHVAFFGCV